ncbi:VWA domain-containing protein [Diaphorobacter aerolatus]|uniref:VWA domain-containing protein n=1 Tax=Diaphorobacter aerolatus TaxID=1288495 RepID=A0A7H0GND9_9BURK|nr:VWA domain-containing protein [Diaphorobacter aerolatus]QNP49805.1 VWA domain-containing protein [Diaphorobacter aerolatus]
MAFLWPGMLWLLLLLPLLVLVYWLAQRRRRTTALDYPALSLVREAMGVGQRMRRHIPPLLCFIGLAALLLAAARPLAKLSLPSDKQTIVLAMDVSGSMRATDVEPNRLVAAQNAAKAFIAALPRNVRVSVVAFAGTAQIAQLPTQNHEDLNAAIDSFQLQRGTATGNGILMALAAIFPGSGIDLAALSGRDGMHTRSIDEAMNNDARRAPPAPVEPGSFNSAAIVMLSDGQRNTGVDPMLAAQWAADRGVRVYTVGVGTPEGTVIEFEGWSMRVRLDEETLKTVAKVTKAEYFHAATAQDLLKVYETLHSRLTLEKRETEIASLLSLAGALFIILAATLSLWWYGRVM